MSKNVLVYRDAENIPALVTTINGLCGALVVNPRPDLEGEYVVVDIVGIEIADIGTAFVAAALVSVESTEAAQRAEVAARFSGKPISSDILEVGTIDKNGHRHPVPYIPGIAGVER